MSKPKKPSPSVSGEPSAKAGSPSATPETDSLPTPPAGVIALGVAVSACPICGGQFTGNRCETDGYQLVDT